MRAAVFMMFAALAVALTPQNALAQTPQNARDAQQLAARMAQLMESTAVATPGLTGASDPVRRNAAATLNSLEHTPDAPALVWQFMNETKAYLALADSMPRPAPFPAAADQQYAELRAALERTQRYFESMLDAQNRSAHSRDADPNQLNRYAEADAKAPPPGSLPRIVFLGDDAVEAWRLNEYFPGRDLINRAIAGQTTGQMLARFRQDVLSLNPKAVIVMGGAGDIAAGIALRQTEDNLATMGDLAKTHSLRAAFASALPVSDYHKAADPRFEITKSYPPEAIRSLNQWLEGYCRSQGFVFVNYYAAMADSSGLCPPTNLTTVCIRIRKAIASCRRSRWMGSGKCWCPNSRRKQGRSG